MPRSFWRNSRAPRRSLRRRSHGPGRRVAQAPTIHDRLTKTLGAKAGHPPPRSQPSARSSACRVPSPRPSSAGSRSACSCIAASSNAYPAASRCRWRSPRPDSTRFRRGGHGLGGSTMTRRRLEVHPRYALRGLRQIHRDVRHWRAQKPRDCRLPLHQRTGRARPGQEVPPQGLPRRPPAPDGARGEGEEGGDMTAIHLRIVQPGRPVTRGDCQRGGTNEARPCAQTRCRWLSDNIRRQPVSRTRCRHPASACWMWPTMARGVSTLDEVGSVTRDARAGAPARGQGTTQVAALRDYEPDAS